MSEDFVRELLRVTDWGILVYFVALNSSYLVLIVMAGLEFAKHLRRTPFSGADDMFRSPLTLPVTLIVPAHNASDLPPLVFRTTVSTSGLSLATCTDSTCDRYGTSPGTTRGTSTRSNCSRSRSKVSSVDPSSPTTISYRG